MTYYYDCLGVPAASALSDLPLRRMDAPEEPVTRFLLHRPPQAGRAAFCPSHPKQLSAGREGVEFLDPDRLDSPVPALPPDLLRRMAARQLTAVDLGHPRWEDALMFCRPRPRRKQVNLLAVGDVGGTMLTALKLLGGDCIETIGICDLNGKTVQRWVAEMGQIAAPWDYDAFPNVVAVGPERLFSCDAFVFIATKSIPAVGQEQGDVRMAQFAANRSIVEHYAKQARAVGYRGMFIVMSDPVDPLCKAAWLASNQDGSGNYDGLGLLPEQIQGFGLGVMNARAAYFAKQKRDYRLFLSEGRSFGPHGRGLVIANSISRYDDAASRALTTEVIEANLRIRELGFKPYVAPAISSGALQLLLLLRGGWHCSSVYLGGVWFGCRNRFTPAGVETEALAMPDPLFSRLKETEQLLREII